MTEEEERFVYALQGQILACQKMNESLLLAVVLQMRPNDPISMLDAFEKGMVGGMQHTTFHDPDGGDVPSHIVDLGWETAGLCVRQMFTNVREKLAARTIE